MVYSSEKWLCGIGNRMLYYCEFCYTPYNTEQEALECEKKHKKSVMTNE